MPASGRSPAGQGLGSASPIFSMVSTGSSLSAFACGVANHSSGERMKETTAPPA
jgi:hypothetical protein